jgi:protein MON2
VAALCLPAVLTRCGGVLSNYVADCKLRGNVPFPRLVPTMNFGRVLNPLVRPVEEELLCVLGKLLELRLWSGTLWAAFQERPSEVAVEQPCIIPS